MKKLKVLLLIFVLTLVGCTSIPKEAPELSIELGKKIKSLEDAHMSLVEEYFSMKKDLLNRFFEDKWMPDLADEFFRSSVLEEKWLHVVKSNDNTVKMQFILEVAPVLVEVINTQKQLLFKPLEDLQRDVEKEIRNGYDESYAINNSLTSYLISAHKVDQTRKSFVENLGLKEKKYNDMIIKINDITESLVKSTENIPEKADKYAAEIKKLREGMR